MSNQPGTYWKLTYNDGKVEEITAIHNSETETNYVFTLDDDGGTIEVPKADVSSCVCTGIKPGFL